MGELRHKSLTSAHEFYTVPKSRFQPNLVLKSTAWCQNYIGAEVTRAEHRYPVEQCWCEHGHRDEFASQSVYEADTDSDKNSKTRIRSTLIWTRLPVGIGSTTLLIAWMICCESSLNTAWFFLESSPFLMMVNVPCEFMFSQVHCKLFITFTDRALFEVSVTRVLRKRFLV